MRLRVTEAMTARFFGSVVHGVYATFAIVEHAEYASRQAILPFLSPEEDAVGSEISLRHIASAPVGAVVEISASVIEQRERSILCRVEARWNETLLAEGTTEQRIVSKERLKEKIASLYNDPISP